MIRSFAYRLPRFGRDVWLVSIACGLATGAHLGMMQLLKVIYVLRLGYGPEFVGVLFATGALSFAAASIPGGALGSRFGPRAVMIAGLIINVLGMGLLPLTEVVPKAVQPFWPQVVQFVTSSGWSMVMVNQAPALMAFTAPENRKNAFALKEAVAGLGLFGGTFVGGLLPAAFAGMLGLTTAQPAPYRYALWVPVVLGLAALVPMIRARTVPRVVSNRRVGKTTLRALLPLGMVILCGLLNNGAVASCKAFASAYMDREFGLPTSLIGALSSIGMGLAILSAIAGPRLARRRGSGFAMLVASLGLAFSLLVMALVPHWAAAGFGVIGQFALSAVFVPGFQVLQMELAEPESRSLVSGASSMAMSLGFGSMSLTGGYIVAAAGYQRVFSIGAVLALTSAVLMSILLRRRATRPGMADVVPS